MSRIPQGHVQDALKLDADGRVILFQIYPLTGGTIYLKSDEDETWQGTLYEGVPMQLTGQNFTNDGSSPTPTLTIGQQDIDLLPFKGLVHDGHLDGAQIVKYTVLVDDLVNNRNIKMVENFRVKRIQSYSRSQISLVLAPYSSATSQTLPFRQYLPPSFPWVQLQ